MNGSSIERVNREMNAEIQIRGRFITMSCDIEYTLLNIMAYSAPDPNNQIRRFKNMMMHEKINCTIADLKNHKPQYYDEYKDYLDKLYSFKEWRNDFCHYKMNFPDKEDLSKFDMVFVDEEGGIEGVKLRHYTISLYNEAITNFKKLNWKLVQLWMELKKGFDNDLERPLVHPNTRK